MKRLTVILMSLGFVACSGGGGSGGGGGGSTAPNTQAQFIDAPVKGLAYTGSLSGAGKTGSNGMFSCVRGEFVKFSLKGFDLGYAACGEKVFVADLHSHDAGYTWQKAASVIQSFSTTSGSDLDLSAAEASSLSLNGLAYSDGSFESTVSGKVSSVPGAAAVSVSDAEDNANDDMAASITLDPTLEAILSSLEGQDITIKGNLTSGTSFPTVGEQCHPHVKAKGLITKSTHGGKDVYTFSISSPIGYANEGDTFGFDCGSNSACVKIDTRIIPKSKIIYSSNLDLIYRNDSVAGYNVVNGIGETEIIGDVKATANFSPVINVSGGQLVLTGTYHSNVHIVSGAGQYSMANGKTINCKYAMTISQ